jgi:hypothetical protein
LSSTRIPQPSKRSNRPLGTPQPSLAAPLLASSG